MNPYYIDKEAGITIYNSDCRKVLPELQDKSIDITLTDFPYAIGLNYGRYVDTEENLKLLIHDVMSNLLRVSKITLITCGVKNMYFYPRPDWVMSWITPAGIGSGKWGFCCWQPILTYGDDPYIKKGKGSRPDIFIVTENTEIRQHPVSKPVGIWIKIIQRVSLSNKDIIFDPMMGSGTTLMAAKMLGRKCIGIEINREYCDLAIDRLRQEVIGFKI